jgi:hypothetical protein
LEFFNSLSGNLEIELTEAAQPIGGLLNVAAPPDAKVLSLRRCPEVYEPETDLSRSLTPEELARVVFEAPEIRLRGESGAVVSHRSPNGTEFSVQDLLNAVEATERQTRGSTEWLGGVDVHHCYFEGIHEREGGVWEIDWGS